MDFCIPQNLSNIAWSYSTIGRRADPLYRAIARGFQEKTPELMPLDMSLAAWSFAWMQLYHAKLFKCLRLVSSTMLADYSSAQLLLQRAPLHDPGVSLYDEGPPAGPPVR